MKQKMNRDHPPRMAGKQERLKGIRIKKCCASCAWKVLIDSLVNRKCRRWRKKVKPRHCCGCWEMSEALIELKIEKLKS